MSAIKFHDVMHGFRSVRVTGTVALVSKLLQHLMAMKEAVLIEVFFDLQKSYDALYWDRHLKILTAYGVGPMAL